MAYKNPQDKTDYMREYMRRKRALEKLERANRKMKKALGMNNNPKSVTSLAISTILEVTLIEAKKEHPDKTFDQIVDKFIAELEKLKSKKPIDLFGITNRIFQSSDTKLMQVAGGGMA